LHYFVTLAPQKTANLHLIKLRLRKGRILHDPSL